MLKKLFILFLFLIVLSIAGVVGIGAVYVHFGQDLPEHKALVTYEPPVMSRVYTADGHLLAEYARQHRVFVPIEAIPARVVLAFVAAEDQRFYAHFGIDLIGIGRAILSNIKNIGSDKRLIGASSITQQVAKNFFLNNELSWQRKIKEAILSIRIENALGKSRIMELYLNEIYLGFRSYGVATAALNYFDKSLDELTIEEAAYLAALPKAPNNYHPIRYAEAAVERRNWVIERMAEEGYIASEQAIEAMRKPLVITAKSQEIEFTDARYFAEEVRRELIERYGEEALYEGGLVVHTTLDTHLQSIANDSLRWGLETYDRRHGYRGPLAHIEPQSARGDADLRQAIATYQPPGGLQGARTAIVTAVHDPRAEIVFGDGTIGHIPLEQLIWARQYVDTEEQGPAIEKASDVLQRGDIVIATPILPPTEATAIQNTLAETKAWGLGQIPRVQGALVALDPHTGRVLAMMGGYDYEHSEFNRVVQAYRQPGSAFKPFVYLSALNDHRYTPSTRILDAPFVIGQGPHLPKWRPANYTKRFYGAVTMRTGIEKSRNLMTVRLAQAVGMDNIIRTAQKFGIVDDMPQHLSMSLGARETTLLRLTRAYAMLVNGGRQITSSFISRIQDRNGNNVFKHDTRSCMQCATPYYFDSEPPVLPDTRAALTDPISAYQITSMLEGVVERGTGRRIRSIGKPLAGKTGTTNNQVDTWFIGFSPDLAVGVFVGMDIPEGLGKGETGSSVTAPIFKRFMEQALAGQPAVPFRIPSGAHLFNINQETGALAKTGDKKIILEAFAPGTAPTSDQPTEVLVGNQEDSTVTPRVDDAGASRIIGLY